MADHIFEGYDANPGICRHCGAVRPMPCYELKSIGPDAPSDDLRDLIAEVLAAENVRLVGSHLGHWEEAAPAIAKAVRWHYRNLDSEQANPSSADRTEAPAARGDQP